MNTFTIFRLNIALQIIAFYWRLANYASNLSHLVNDSSYISCILNQISHDVNCGLFFVLTMLNVYA